LSLTGLTFNLRLKPGMRDRCHGEKARAHKQREQNAKDNPSVPTPSGRKQGRGPTQNACPTLT
jgi:hypothetical protein